MSDLLFSADLDGGKFRDGLDRLRATVREKHNEMVRDWANASDRLSVADRQAHMTRTEFMERNLDSVMRGMNRSIGDLHKTWDTSLGLTSREYIRLGVIGIGTAIGGVVALRKAMEGYAEKTSIGIDSVRNLRRTMDETAMAAGRFAFAVDAGPKLEWVYKARAGLFDLGREFLQTIATGGDVAAAMEFTRNAKELEAVAREYKAYVNNLELANRQLAQMKELEGDTLGAAKLQARARYEQSVDAIYATQGLSGSQRSDRVDDAAKIRELEIAKAIGEQEAKKVGARDEMVKIRADRLRDEVKAGEVRDKDAARDREELDRQREAWRIDIERMRVDEVRAKGDERATRVAQLRLELEEKMSRLGDSKLPELEKRRLRRSIAESLQAQLSFADQEQDPKKAKRSDGIAGSIDPGLGGGSLLYQVFGGNPRNAEAAKEQTAELKVHTGLLRELVAKFAADIATFAP